MTEQMIEALYRTRFEAFVQFAFGELRPNDRFAGNWHIDLLVDRLQPITEGKPTRMVVNMPPRHLKSMICSQALPAFLIGNDPTKQIMLIVGSDELAQEFHAKLVKLMDGKRYRSLFPHLRMRWTKRSVISEHGGYIRIVTVGKGLSGRGADLIIIDDPISPSHAKNDRKRQAVNDWYREEVITRLNTAKSSSLLLVMQRVHREDLSGYISGADSSFEHLILPSVAIEDETWTLSDGEVVTRKAGELLHPERADINELLRALDRLDGQDFCRQHLQLAYAPPINPDREYHIQTVWGPLPKGWTPNDPPPEYITFFPFTSQEYVLRDVFKIPPPDPQPLLESPITRDEQQLVSLRQSELLDEHLRRYSPYDDLVVPMIYPQQPQLLSERGSLFGPEGDAIFAAAHEDRYERPNASG